MIIDFKSWKYQEIYDHIKTFENKIKCVEPVKNKIYENGFKTALLNSELFKFYHKFKRENGLKEYNIYYPAHTNKSFNIIYSIILKNPLNEKLVNNLMNIYNSMIYELYFYDQVKTEHNMIKIVEEGIFESELNFNDENILKNMNFKCDEIKNVKEYLSV